MRRDARWPLVVPMAESLEALARERRRRPWLRWRRVRHTGTDLTCHLTAKHWPWTRGTRRILCRDGRLRRSGRVEWRAAWDEAMRRERAAAANNFNQHED